MELDEDDQNTEEPFSRDLVSLESPETGDIFGEPLVHPRIGDEYQAQIPPMLEGSDRLRLLINPAEAGETADVSHSFVMGLPVPITWIYKDVETIKDESNGSINKPAGTAHSNGFLNSETYPMKSADPPNKDQDFEVGASVHLHGNSGYYPVPGLPMESWSDFEVDCFLLGLYIFGKNLLHVRNFMGSKDMGQILSFYYGRFYRSPTYRKWSVCRKMRKKRCVVGQRLFMGGRQQELFSRLLPYISEESKSSLQEVFKAYSEGRTSMEDFVSTLKAKVGLRALIEAVGIGKGKEDLTTFLVDTSHATRVSSSRHGLPSSKACSSLTCAEIIKHLTGDFRLSKTRSNDLFWEAVWPRLLAKGWQSEQPKDEGYKSSKNSLVFLVPGIKKFSRRKLVKGDHYFDSVSDVLNKVASQPELLELEAGEARDSSSKAENGWAAVSVSDSDSDDVSDHEPRCFLKARVSFSSTNLLKFTVVDTSLADGEKPSKIRELKNLPLQAKSSSVLRNRPRVINGISARKSAEVPLMGDTLSRSPRNHIHESHVPDLENGVLENQVVASNSLKPLNGLLERLTDQETRFSGDKQPRAIKHQFSRRPKQDRPTSRDPALKRRKLLACNVTSTMPTVGESDRVSVAQETDVASADHSPAPLSSADVLAAGDSLEKNQDSATLRTFQEHDEKPEVPQPIDLIEPKLVVIEPETRRQIKVEAKRKHYSQDPAVESESVVLTEEKPVVSGRRQSTRNRPLTTRALEALATGMLSPKRTRKSRESWSPEGKKPRLSVRQRRRKAALISPHVGEDTYSRTGGYDMVSDGTAQSFIQKSGPPAQPCVRNSEPENVEEGTDFERNGYDGVRFSLARMLSHKSSPSSQIHLRKTVPTNGSFGEGTSSSGNGYDRFLSNVISEIPNLKPRSAGLSLTRNTESSDCHVGEVTDSRKAGYAWVSNSIPETLDQIPRPSGDCHARNAETVGCNVVEGIASKCSPKAKIPDSLAQTPDKNSRPSLGPRLRVIMESASSGVGGNTSSVGGNTSSVGGNTESGGSGYAGLGKIIIPQSPYKKFRPSIYTHVRSVAPANCAGEGAKPGSSEDTCGGSTSMTQTNLNTRLSDQTHVRSTESANHIGEVPVSGGIAPDREPRPVVRLHIRHSNSATASASEGTESSGHARVSSSVGDKPKQKSRPSGRSRAKNKESGNGNVGEGLETSGVGAVNSPIFQANQQVARELWGFSRSSSFSKS